MRLEIENLQKSLPESQFNAEIQTRIAQVERQLAQQNSNVRQTLLSRELEIYRDFQQQASLREQKQVPAVNEIEFFEPRVNPDLFPELKQPEPFIDDRIIEEGIRADELYRNPARANLQNELRLPPNELSPIAARASRIALNLELGVNLSIVVILSAIAVIFYAIDEDSQWQAQTKLSDAETEYKHLRVVQWIFGWRIVSFALYSTRKTMMWVMIRCLSRSTSFH